MPQPRLFFGGGSIGRPSFDNVQEVQGLLKYLKTRNVVGIDTAATYQRNAPGRSEQLLGEAQIQDKGLQVDTKILVADPTGKGTLSPKAIEESLKASVARLQAPIEVLYCHLFDSETPLLDTVSALQEHQKAGSFSTLGVSNFNPEQLSSFLRVCKSQADTGTTEATLAPKVYQGQYNPLCRKMEQVLLPQLRENGMALMGYSPLAGGFLTGAFTSGENLDGTRFAPGNPVGEYFKRFFDKAAMHTAIRELQVACTKHAVGGPAEASLRWLYYHSSLEPQDGLILGARNMEQIAQNLDHIALGPLPDGLVDVFEKIWKDVADLAP